MDKLKKMLPYLIIIVLAFYLLPIFPEDTAGFMFTLLFATPFLCFTAALIYGAKWGFDFVFSLLTAVLFIPAVFIFYNSSALIYIVVYGLAALLGTALGGLLINNKK